MVNFSCLMKKKQADLYRIEPKGGNWYRLTAYLRKDGSLYLEGQDFTVAASEMFGDEEYEYGYSFNPENAEKLKLALGVKDLVKGLVAFFNGELKNKEFLKFCEEHGVEYRRSSI